MAETEKEKSCEKCERVFDRKGIHFANSFAKSQEFVKNFEKIHEKIVFFTERK